MTKIPEPVFDGATPFLLLNRAKVKDNINRLRTHLQALGTPWRPHLKTAKSLEVAGLLFPNGPGPITVSTLGEAEYFARAGYADILYAVGIAPGKLDRVQQLRDRGVELTILVDNISQAEAIAAHSRQHKTPFAVLIEVDADGHRAGLAGTDPQLLEVARILREGGAQVRGVMTHAGGSYFAHTRAEQQAAAENERSTAVAAAERLRAAGHQAPTVSIGSTPTALAATDLSGVTEVRAGNFVFFDLVMAGIGVCELADLALTVVTTVIGHREEFGWIITDAGWTATSRDTGTSVQPVDQHYGLAATAEGEIIPDLIMVNASQEHGVLAIRPGVDRPLPQIPVGTQLRILPIHACATASEHTHYQVIEADGLPISDRWERTGGW